MVFTLVLNWSAISAYGEYKEVPVWEMHFTSWILQSGEAFKKKGTLMHLLVLAVKHFIVNS